MKQPAYPTAVREMPAEERPRERLANLGPEALRDAELIAVLFRSYFQPFIVMAAIPYALVGAIFGHLIMGFNISLISLLRM